MWLGWTLALLVAAGFARLGVWQLARMHEKEALLAAVHGVVAQQIPNPMSLAADPDRAHDFDWAFGDGRMVNVPAVLLDNQTRNGIAGMRVYRLFVPGVGEPLLVEMGWVPMPTDRNPPPFKPIAVVQRLQGLLMPPPSPGLVTARAVQQPDGSILTTAIDAPELPRLLGVAKLPPRVLRLDPAMKDIGYARDLDVLPNTLPPSRHLGYAVQWFALAVAVLATAVVLTFRKPRA